MNEQNILEDILVLLEANRIKIRRELLEGSGGGLCRIRGESVLFLDTEASVARQAAVCAEALKSVVDIESIYLRPEVRRFIEDRTAGNDHENQI